MPDKYEFKVDPKTDIADVYIFGQIGVDNAYWEAGTNNVAYAQVTKIKELGNTHSRLNVHIQSPGGSIADGLAIFNILRSVSADVHTYNQGTVASMASIILLAPQKKENIHQPVTSIFHLHRASLYMDRANVTQLQNAIDSLLVFEDVLQNAISQLTGLTKEDVVAKWFDGLEHFMSATEATSFGFGTLEDVNTTAPAPAPETLKNLSFNDFMAAYKATKPSKIGAFISNFFSSLSFVSNPKQENPLIPIKMYRIQNLLLAALLVCFEFKMEAGNVSIPEPKMKVIEDEITRATKAEKTLTAENTAQKETIAALEAKIVALGGKPENVVTPPAGGKDAKLDTTAYTSAELQMIAEARESL